MKITQACVLLVAISPLLGAQMRPASDPSTMAIDAFVKRCDITSPSFSKLIQKGLSEKSVLEWRGHPLIGIASFDADAGSAIQAYFADTLDPGDDDFPTLWYSSRQAIRENSGSAGTTYETRQLKLPKRGDATLSVVNFKYVDQKTGKLTESGARKGYPYAPANAGWMVECSIRY